VLPLNDAIIIRGARTHNLKNISCEIPHGKLTVVSGVSGSGKSSLAFDTIYAEGQRRYVESPIVLRAAVSGAIEKPDVTRSTSGAGHCHQSRRIRRANPRSTVATATEIYDYLRLLYARAGRCIACSAMAWSNAIQVDEAAEAILALGEGTRLNALFPVVTATPTPENAAAARKARPKRRALDEISAKTKPVVNGGDSPHTETLKARLAEFAFAAVQFACGSRAGSSSSPRPSRCSIWTSRCQCLCFWTALPSALKIGRASWTRSRPHTGGWRGDL